MSNLHLPTNHCVMSATLAALRARHPLVLEATKYRPDRYFIGYGHQGNMSPDLTISPCQAEDLLRNDIQYVEAFIRLSVARRVSDRCYQALVSFLYDVGPKSEHARVRLGMLHDGGERAFFRGLEGGAEWSRYSASVGRSARFFECTQAGA